MNRWPRHLRTDPHGPRTTAHPESGCWHRALHLSAPVGTAPHLRACGDCDSSSAERFTVLRRLRGATSRRHDRYQRWAHVGNRLVGRLQLSRGLDVTALVTESAIDSLEIQAPFGVVCLIHSLRRRYFPHLRRDSPRPGRICAGNGLTLATSGRLPSRSHLRRDSPHPCHIHSLRHRDARGRLPGLLLNTQQ